MFTSRLIHYYRPVNYYHLYLLLQIIIISTCTCKISGKRYRTSRANEAAKCHRARCAIRRSPGPEKGAWRRRGKIDTPSLDLTARNGREIPVLREYNGSHEQLKPMGDTEFEQFRRYFDRLPQYIKAPAHTYTWVPTSPSINGTRTSKILSVSDLPYFAFVADSCTTYQWTRWPSTCPHPPRPPSPKSRSSAAAARQAAALRAIDPQRTKSRWVDDENTLIEFVPSLL